MLLTPASTSPNVRVETVGDRRYLIIDDVAHLLDDYRVAVLLTALWPAVRAALVDAQGLPAQMAPTGAHDGRHCTDPSQK